MSATIESLRRVGDPTKEAIWVSFSTPVAGHKKGRLIGIGRKYCRIMFGDGTIWANGNPGNIKTVWK